MIEINPDNFKGITVSFTFSDREARRFFIEAF